MVKELALFVGIAGAAQACSPQAKQATRDYLNGIVTRIDFARVASCATHLAEAPPDYSAAAECLSGFAIATVSDELKIAIDKAVEVATDRLEQADGKASAMARPDPAAEAVLAELQLQIAIAGAE